MSWYKTAKKSDNLEQGDLIFDFPVFTWDEGEVDESVVVFYYMEGKVIFRKLDLVVLTQSCDIEQGKVAYILLCPHYDIKDFRDLWTEQRNRENKSTSNTSFNHYIQSISKGRIHGNIILNYYNSYKLNFNYRIVVYSETFSVPIGICNNIISKRGIKRVKMRSPYKEHLSQSFARFIMRVGLPINIDESKIRM